MQTQAVKVQTRTQKTKTKISNHKQLCELTGEKSPLSCCTVIQPLIPSKPNKQTTTTTKDFHGLTLGTIMTMSNPWVLMKAVILKANIQKRTIREIGRERNGRSLWQTDNKKKKSSWSFVYCNCQNLQRLTITHGAIFYSLPFLGLKWCIC